MSSHRQDRLFSEPELGRIALYFKMLGEPMRLKILEAVCRGPLTVGEIVTAVGATQANVSKHLALLATAGILVRKKEGQSVFYRLKDPLTVRICKLVHDTWSK